MMAMVVDNAVERRMREWLSNALFDSAKWRQAKAEEYQDDARNSNSATALFDAASYVRNPNKQGGGIFRMTQLVAACTEIEYELITEDNEYPGPRSERVAARYRFQSDFPPLGKQEHDRLLLEIFVASLGDIRDQLEDDIPPESGLAKLIAEHLPAVPASPDETMVELLTEIRDLLRDRLPSTVETPVET